MTEDLLDTDEDVSAQDDQIDQDIQVDTDQADQEPQKPFTPEQEQYIGSWMGRIVKRHVEDAVRSSIPAHQPQPDYSGQTGATPIDKLNEKLQERIFSGDVYGALSDVVDLKEKARKNLTDTQMLTTDRAITGFSEDPYYKEIFSDVQKVARQYVGQGYPPKAAAETAFHKVKTGYLERKVSGDRDTSNLGMLSGGRRVPGKKTIKLPPQFKKAAAREIADGIFKDEAEYIAHLQKTLPVESQKKYGMM